MVAYRYRDLEFCAENGIIHMFDHKSGTFQQILVSEWAHRLDGLRRAVAYMPHSEVGSVKDFDRSILAALPKMEAVLNEAIAQGNPENPRVMADMMTAAKNRYIVVDK